MALTPISMFQPQGAGIAQFLQGGQGSLTALLNNVVQVGRDQANKQFAQERDFLGERARTEALAQRRGENLQTQANTDRNFARNMFTSDRDFTERASQFDESMDQRQTEFEAQQKRYGAEDLFRRDDADRNYDLRKTEAERLKKSQDLTIAEQERAAAERNRMEGFSAGVLKETAPSSGPQLSAEYLYGPVNESSAPDAGSPEAIAAQAQIEMDAAKGRDPDRYVAAARRKAEADAKIAEAKRKADLEMAIEKRDAVGLTPGQEATQQRFEATQKSKETAAAEKAAVDTSKTLIGDTAAFPVPTAEVMAKLDVDPAALGLGEASTNAAVAERDRLAYEVSATWGKTKEQYVNAWKGGAKPPAEVRKKREAFYDKWKDKDPTKSGSKLPEVPNEVIKDFVPPAKPAPSSESDWLDKQLKGL